ncbi:MAG TPA: KR domain-containing protein [Acinetobacter ursingii]|nr:SDR family NAD(P)-dependent oxidoreductase [Acinetobacter ursingii]MCH2004943.1 SDR family NAD(P)-dependent oxidoreductase [Acinetobacter ursingii]MCU4304456.1 SDR family NAD(P)-dependent oxidoreductase [Acinetobacter ursingii]MCU4370461.1 SDR family NAD(P)-dependent oxidoreductase [Acinetobacter ursingii]MCU4380290.1 SDR family NAD(P)-dependent oxidoreductase [Acinetobacter ursingii]MCU4609707.1 SDR family NAD(P)-dependent oxidoreductase [Acinetobacter ursingii]
MKIQGKHFIITGGASGLGAATAECLVVRGAYVTLVDMNVEAVQAQAEKLGTAADFVAIDVTNEIEVAQFFKQTLQQHGAIHGLINCAGIGPSAKVVGKEGIHDLALFNKVLNINVTGTFNMLRFAAEAMTHNTAMPEDEDRGVIINTASVAAFDGQIGQAAYAASKGAIVAMTLPIARELGRHAIRVVTIAPGIMETPMLKALPQNVQDSLGQMVPYPSRLGKPDEFASLAVHIIENAYLNGEVIRLDGAIRMAPK